MLVAFFRALTRRDRETLRSRLAEHAVIWDRRVLGILGALDRDQWVAGDGGTSSESCRRTRFHSTLTNSGTMRSGASSPREGRSPVATGAPQREVANALRTYYASSMAKSTTSIRLPEELVGALDRRAAALGLTRSQLIVQAIERTLEGYSAWSPAFLKAIGTPRPELEESVDEMMDAIRARRSRSDAPRL